MPVARSCVRGSPLSRRTGNRRVKLKVDDEAQGFFHYGAQVLDSEPEIRQAVINAISGIERARFGPTPGQRYGLDIADFNRQLRQALLLHGQQLHSEVGWTSEFADPFWTYPQPRSRHPGFRGVGDLFDFARIDPHHNATVMWNLLASGRVPADAEAPENKRFRKYATRLLRAHWDGVDEQFAECRCVRDRVEAAGITFEISGGLPEKLTDSQLRRLLTDPSGLPVCELPAVQKPFILGEVQAGNWALTYRDIGRLLAVKGTFREPPINLFVIIVLHGCLAELLSDGTVNYRRTQRVYRKVGQDVPVPTWVVGVDFDHSDVAASHPG